MIVYISMLLISIFFLYIAGKMHKKWERVVCYILAVLPFFLVSALRYDLGTDYLRRYHYDYNRIAQGIYVKNLELGFQAMVKFCLLFTKESYLLFVVTSAIIIGCIMYRIIKSSKNPILSVFIFFLGGFFFDSLNIMRQYLAMSMVFFAYPFLLEKKKWIWYILCVIIAGMMHSSAFVMLMLLLLTKKMLVSWKWVLPCAVILLIVNENLLQIIGWFLQGTRFNVYLTGKFAQGDVSYLFIAENLIIYALFYYIYQKNQKRDSIEKTDILFLNIQGLALLTMVLGACHMLFIRSALYFSIFQVISLPYYISKMPVGEMIEDVKRITKQKINLEKYKKKIPQYVTIFTVVCFLFAFTRTNIMNNTNEVLPYKTILNKEISID